jgi:SPX domain protein involved in polyphosphate accumulation
MKYAKQLALRTIPAWCVDYIDYKALKKFIREQYQLYLGKFIKENSFNHLLIYIYII